MSYVAQIFWCNNKCNAKNNKLLPSINFNRAVRVDVLISSKAIKAYWTWQCINRAKLENILPGPLILGARSIVTGPILTFTVSGHLPET